MKRIILFSIIVMLSFSVMEAQAYTLSGEITGGVFLGGITYVYAVSTEFTGGLPDFYIGLALLGVGNYAVLFVPDGDYILFAYQDRDYNLIPSIDDYFGYYGDTLPEIVTVSGNVSGLDIEISPMPFTSISGTLAYGGNNTGLTFLQAASDPEFENVEHFSVLLDTAGTGEYTIFAQPGQYFVRAFMDLDLSITYSTGDPMGYYGYPDPPMMVDITGGSAQNVDFTMYDPLQISLSLEPIGAPIVIPSQGGQFQFSATLENMGSAPALFDVWTDVLLPDSSVYGPIILREMNMTAGSQVMRNLTQSVPGGAPSGGYTYRGYAGIYPDEIMFEDSFNFEKSAFAEAGTDAFDWSLQGWENEVDEASNIWLNVRLYPVFPNPFNTSTILTFTLAEKDELRISLYDVQGRFIRDLVNGSFPAGIYRIDIDGSELTSGVYFARMTAGNISATVKLVLQK